MSDRKKCPDGGTCHHQCAEKCFRVNTCEPLSGVFPGDTWPEGVRAQHANAPARQEGDGIRCGLTGSELLLRSDLERTALDAYSLFTVKTAGDHAKAIKAAVAAAILRLSDEERRTDCSGGAELVNGMCCPSCSAAPSDEAWWLRQTALRLDPDIETRE